MEKNVHVAVRVKPSVAKKLNEIARITRYFKGDILEKLILNTKIDPVTKDFFVNCSSGGPDLNDKK